MSSAPKNGDTILVYSVDTQSFDIACWDFFLIRGEKVYNWMNPHTREIYVDEELSGWWELPSSATDPMGK